MGENKCKKFEQVLSLYRMAYFGLQHSEALIEDPDSEDEYTDVSTDEEYDNEGLIS